MCFVSRLSSSKAATATLRRNLALPLGSLAQSNKVISKKKAGRPATGNDPVRAIRLSDDFLAKVDTWAENLEDQPGRSEAIRRLVELGLKAKSK